MKVAGYFENIGKAKQNSFSKVIMRLFLASTSLFPKFLFSKLIALDTSEISKIKLGASVE